MAAISTCSVSPVWESASAARNIAVCANRFSLRCAAPIRCPISRDSCHSHLQRQLVIFVQFRVDRDHMHSGGITFSRLSSTFVHEKALRSMTSFKNCESSRVVRFSGRFRNVGLARVDPVSRSTPASLMAWRSRRALINPVIRGQRINVSRPSEPRAVPQRIQNCRASSYGWLARLISSLIEIGCNRTGISSGDQCSHHSCHSPPGN